MTLEELQNEWASDSKIDASRLDEEALKISRLHSKYMNLLSTTKVQLRRLTEKRKKLEGILEDYYTGVIDGKDIGREPFQLPAGTRGQTERRIEKDPLVVQLNIKLVEIEECALFLKEVISSINQRTWHLKNAIDFIRWSGGQL